MVAQMVSVGEESGQLETMLEKVADFYDAEVDAKVKALTSLIEPVMIIFIGVIVGFIVISMYLPIFKLYDSNGASCDLVPCRPPTTIRAITRPRRAGRRGWERRT